MIFEKIELYVLKVIKGQKKGLFPKILIGILALLSGFYRLVVDLRNVLYDQGWFRKYHPPVPLVISVGNLVAGGTGKTPVTLLLAQEYYLERTLAILSRGYRSKAQELSLPVVLCHGEGPIYPASYCGDEPYLMAQRLPKALLIVGKDRKKAADIAAKAGVSVLLLDDGMQHRSLARDYEIIVMDALDPFGLDRYLPRGFLREGKKGLSRGDLIVLNHVRDEAHFFEVKKKIEPYVKAPIVGVNTRVEGVFDLSGKPVTLEKGEKVALFCGIAHPEYFKETLLGLGCNVVAEKALGDHRECDKQALIEFTKLAKKKEAKRLLCTEKDKVKLPMNVQLDLPVDWIKMQLTWVAGFDLWRDFITKTKRELSTRV